MSKKLIFTTIFSLCYLAGCSEQKQAETSAKSAESKAKPTVTAVVPAVQVAVNEDKIKCEEYKVAKIAAITAVAEPTFACSNMIRDDAYSQFVVSTEYKNGKCYLNVFVSGIIDGNSKTCNISKEVDKVEDNRVMFVRP